MGRGQGRGRPVPLSSAPEEGSLCFGAHEGHSSTHRSEAVGEGDVPEGPLRTEALGTGRSRVDGGGVRPWWGGLRKDGNAKERGRKNGGSHF